MNTLACLRRPRHPPRPANFEKVASYPRILRGFESLPLRAMACSRVGIQRAGFRQRLAAPAVPKPTVSLYSSGGNKHRRQPIGLS